MPGVIVCQNKGYDIIRVQMHILLLHCKGGNSNGK
nr:MAG TPA: hypothetical protein [Caudoviricetes sp.]